jgi:hypothetical protein
MVDRSARLTHAHDGWIACALCGLAHELARRGCASTPVPA